MADTNICYIATLALSVGLVIFGFLQLLGQQKAGENELQVIQRQLRGFAFLALAQIVLVGGMALCVGLNLDSFKKMVRSVKL